MAILQYIQSVPFEIDGAIKVHFVKSLHGDLGLAAISQSVRFRVKIEVMFDGSAWEGSFLILPW